MASDTVIRDLRPDDVEAVVGIAAVAWAPAFSFRRRMLGDDLFAAAYANWNKEAKARQVRTACEPGNHAMVCVAEKQGRVVGFTTFYATHASRLGEVGNNAVHPDFQGLGIGPQMYKYVLARLRGLGMRFVKVSTEGDPAHASARKAYEKVGFSIQVPRIEYYLELRDTNDLGEE
ncbi:MAG: GNAT family N-acetyltransferase [Armatimonadetes bacterium]|nr:GNAT family N-acetyltransferase [Armatimonadota bacterium]